MTSRSTAFGKTLAFVTRVKLQELEKRRTAFAIHSAQVAEDARKHQDNLERQVTTLVEGIKSWPGPWSSSGEFSLSNIEAGLAQARSDPGFPRSLLIQWHSQLQLRFSRENTQFEYARLFGNLLTEWLTSQEGRTPVNPASEQDAFEKVSRKETMEQQEKLESIIFEPKMVDVAGLTSYLDGIFASEEAKKALESLRREMKKCGEEIRKAILTVDDVKWCIQSLLSSDLLSDEKQDTLREFLQNDVIVTELVSVLNMQITSLSSWSWPDSGVIVEPRRHLNGKIRFFLDYEILTAMLLHYVGMKWSVVLKSGLRGLFANSAAWKQRTKPVSPLANAKYNVFIGKSSSYDPTTIENQRRNFQRQDVFMCQLPSTLWAKDNYDSDGIDTSDGEYGTSQADLKQKLLHFMSADILIKETLHGQCTVVRTDIEWFGPSLSHSTVLTVLEYLGVPQLDLQFFKAFLACPLQFQSASQSSMEVEARVRLRGLPISHALTTFCAEAALFLVDYTVNQRADGLFLYRIHDDFWFWDHDTVRCVTAWQEMGHLLDLMGLKFNKEKTGSVHVGKVGDLHSALPSGDIRWGFLRMDPSRNGQFIIDRGMVDQHIGELKRQLDATTSVFAWVQAYNKYMAFFTRNFGSPVKVYGRDHVDNIIETFARIQKGLFSSSGGSVLCKLSRTLSEKFGASEIPSGWFLWPMASGGLQVKDPIVDPLAIRENLPESHSKLLDIAREGEAQEYSRTKREWEGGSRHYYQDVKNTSLVSSSDPFFKFEEYIQHRETRSQAWGSAFTDMLKTPGPQHLEQTPDIHAALQVLGTGSTAFGSSAANGWNGLSAYWKWIISLHHQEMAQKFGGLAIVEPSSIPIGMLGVFNTSRTRWEQ